MRLIQPNFAHIPKISYITSHLSHPLRIVSKQESCVPPPFFGTPLLPGFSGLWTESWTGLWTGIWTRFYTQYFKGLTMVASQYCLGRVRPGTPTAAHTGASRACFYIPLLVSLLYGVPHKLCWHLVDVPGLTLPSPGLPPQLEGCPYSMQSMVQSRVQRPASTLSSFSLSIFGKG